ncbi:PREDICTED: thioredoxin-like protein HCF164, chloroplastic [Camelina sativa]|uniref:Thioredoxin-like protein HCF164, chloroplastic n=1 Tax=Camelina sativa TaxID=90675 RepID=A0ABM0TVL2_CAMSA|nr:PREDICTED: thioredoxin-like protein HCF164, chloroplastic [Camelina sativa]
MARLAFSLNLPSSHGGFNLSPRNHPSLFLTQTRPPRFRALRCQPNPDSSETQEKLVVDNGENSAASKEVEPSSSSGFPETPNKDINRRVAAVTVIAALSLFVSTRLDFGISLKDLTASALPYEEALSNGKPTVVEFYADWCEVCRELAPDVYKIEQQYKDKVNFVMLNVDNTKWEQELDEFGVEGIPHFAFLDRKGNEEGNVVGRLPRQYLVENVNALAAGKQSIPHARAVGQYSSAEARKVHQVTDPLSHG